MIYYCTLDEARAETKATSSTITDDELMRSVWQVSRRIDQIMGGRSFRPWFAPYVESRRFPMTSRYWDSSHNTLFLRNAPPLLSLTSITLDGTDATSAAETYPLGEPWFRQVRITSSGDPWYSYVSDCDDPAYTIVTGVWGYHSDYANAWLDTGQTLAAQITAAATSFTVANIDADDPYGIAPVLSRGNLVRFGTGNDFGLVTATDTTTNIGTMRRAVLGSTGAIQAAATAVYTYQVEEPIRRVTARQASFLRARVGAFESASFDGVATTSYPADLLRELAAVCSEYINNG